MYSFLYGLNFSCGVRQPEFPVELQFYSFDFSLSIVYLLILTRPSPTSDVVSLLWHERCPMLPWQTQTESGGC